MSRSTRRLLCQICSSMSPSTHAPGATLCSVPCYKEHKASSCGTSVASSATENGTPLESLTPPDPKNISTDVEEPKPLRSLSSLNWPYVPEQTIATSPTIRKVLSAHPNLPALLTSIDNLRGQNRDLALQLVDRTRPVQLEEDVLALRALAEAVEDAVRGEQKDALGLNWGDD
ncbi:hypothetical protein EV421DRAFT_1844625 [Armillaria borealis]|uniref:HIT-type domain-containing protein n=1 Tax=Armillaria borealis TaxID=47425 RepID=A0AA39J139_9AGAR|nr:hypothetical protein EV421DRAFT_1844625 [Armillaria borealis]